MYDNSGFLAKIPILEEIIVLKLSNTLRYRRYSCPQILEVMNEFTIDKQSIRVEEKFYFYLNKFEQEAIYFYHILND